MRPLPDPSDRDQNNSTVELAFWALVFIALGTLILANKPGREGWPFLLVAAAAYAAAAFFLFHLLVRRD